MVTTVGGAPVDRRTADRLCQNRPMPRPDDAKRRSDERSSDHTR